jgi:hypothetical protein
MLGISGKPESSPALLPLIDSQESDGESTENLDSSDNRSFIYNDLFYRLIGKEEEYFGIFLESKTNNINFL